MKISMKRLGALVLALVMVIGLVPVINNSVNAVQTIDFGGLTDKSIGFTVQTKTGAGKTEQTATTIWNGSTHSVSGTITAASAWTGSENKVTGSLTGRKQTSVYLAATDTVTITNNKTSKANLSFDYKVSGNFSAGTVEVNGVKHTAAGSGSVDVKLEAGGSITIVLNVLQSRNASNQVGIEITNLALTMVGGSAVTATFEAPAYGSYTVSYGSEKLTVPAGSVSQTATNMPSVNYTLTAVTGENYKFVGWLNVTTGRYISTSATYTGSFEEATTVKAVIVPEDAAVFMVDNVYFSDLNEAVAYAQANGRTQINLYQSGTLQAVEGGYTIPAGITLLISMDEEYTATGIDPDTGWIAPEYTTSAETPYAYKTLTLADGVILTVNGTLDVESRHTTLQGGGARPYGGRPSGAYGAIYMSANSNIVVNDGAILYAWGYVYGNGAVTANSGAEVYEIMQVTDFPGGGNMSTFVDTAPTVDLDGDGNPTNDYIKTFPFSQYYVQNIEVSLTLNQGAKEFVFVSMTVQSISMGIPVEFIGANGMFNPTGGAIVKTYNPSTDRLIVDVNGDATMSGIALDMTGKDLGNAMQEILKTSKVDSSSFILTLNSNITININSGTTTIKQDMALLPGVEIYVKKDASLVIAQRTFADGENDNLTMSGSGGYNIYVYDAESFGNFVFSNKKLVPLSYSPTTGRIKRNNSAIKDVIIDVNGTVVCNGFIYSTLVFEENENGVFVVTGGGAAIISSEKTGKIVMQNGCGVEEFAYCLDGTSSADNLMDVDSAWLKNGDGSYLKTSCAACAVPNDDDADCTHIGANFNYCDIHDCWYGEGHGNCAVQTHVEITWIINGEGEPHEVAVNTVPVYLGNPTKPRSGCTVYTFAGWSTSANGEVLSSLPVATEDTVYYAVFTPNTNHVGDEDQDHYCDGNCGEKLSTCEDANEDHFCDYIGCQEWLTGCVDNDQDHYCDYADCGVQTSSCRDDNKDHMCDYSGCQVVMSSCRDDNKDHKCDYSGCQTVLSDCEDNNDDHKCDHSGCQAVMSDCEDLDQDHYCDYSGCNSKLSSCVDTDDHYCDYTGCGKKVSNCIPGEPVEYILTEAGCEAGKKQTIVLCSLCNTELQNDIEEIPALGHGHANGWDYSQVDNDVHHVWCADCWGYDYDAGHSFTNHVCSDCGWLEAMNVQFYNGDELWTETFVPYGGTLGIAGMPIPTAPTGYQFDGWYTANGTKIVHGMTITDNVVCYATWKISSFYLTAFAVDGSALLRIEVPYGANVYDYVKDLVGGSVPVNNEDQIGELVFTGWMDINTNPIVDGYTMPAEDLEVVSNFAFTGWIKYSYIDGWVYESLDQIQKTGWTEIDGSWYYLDTETGIRAEGLTRVSYPTAPINGITYGPNMEDVIYANNKGILFLDATTGLFLFDENGKFLPGYTGLVGDSYAVNGYLVWHYGLVEINGNYYYFIGDVNNGGNVMVKGCDYNVGRNTATNRSFVIGGLYTFGADGAMCMYEGIADVNGVLRYYEDAQLMAGNGLTQVEENFIYVNAYGSLVVDAEYYIGANDKGVDKGIYYFDADGFIVIPEAEPGKSGLFFEEGKWFYYVDGAKAYCAGLIEIDGNLVYVKSDGSLATGVYYVTKTNGHAVIASGTKCTFDDNGILVDPFIGVQVLEEGSIRDDFDYRTDIKLNANGKLTIEVSNIWMDSDVDCVGFNVDIYALNGDYYGEIVRGEGTVEFDLPAGEYTVILYVAWFDDADEDLLGHGKGNLDYKITFIGDGSPLNGIVDGYYYVDGHIGYAAGLIEIDGIFYYVRSNGQIVTDCQYWITNVNDTGYEPGLYEFDCDGWMYEIYVETFTGIKDGYFYIEDEVAYGAGLKQYNGGYVYVRSNGQIATGKYWITNHNGLLPEGFYDFGENGIYYPAIPENAQLLMEVNKNVDTDGFWDYNAIANAVRASADGHIYIEVTDVTFEDELYGQGGFCIAFDGSYWVYQWDEVYKVGTGVVMIPVPADENVVLFVNPADINDEGFDWAYGTISYKIWSDVDCELVQGSTGE